MRVAKCKWLIRAFVVLSLYPTFVLSYVWGACFLSDFQGGKHGQLDAYRHTLASAVVAYTLSPGVVGLISRLMEHNSTPDNLMDTHNNAIGASIGARANSLSEIKYSVFNKVKDGTENAVNRNQTTWLARPIWANSLFW